MINTRSIFDDAPILTGCRVYDVLEECRSIEYSGNGSDRKHEHTILQKFNNHGFKTISREILDEAKKNQIRQKTLKSLIAGASSDRLIIHEPLGSQSAPDFLVADGHKIFYIDAKSSKTLLPTWNSGLPSAETVYIFTSQKIGTTLFLGSEMASKEELDFWENLRIEENKRYDEFSSNNKLQLGCYSRPMYFKKDKQTFVKYGKVYTERALEFVLQKYEK